MQNIIINIGRQLGSGGREIAKRLAEEMGCTFYDSEILNLAAEQSGFDKRFFEKNDERRKFFRNFLNITMPAGGYTANYNNQFSQEGLFQFQSNAIKKAAEQGSCVFVGRCADYVLRDFPNVLNIFITADIQKRVDALMEHEKISREEAEKLIRDKESARASYYNYYTGKKWGSSQSYDLCVNSSRLGIEQTVLLIKNFAENFFSKQSSAAE